MRSMRTFRLVLAVVIAILVLKAAPAYSSHGDVPIPALAIDPLTPTTLYAGTSGGGVFKSTDGGANWSATSLTNIAVSALAIDPLTPTTLYAGTDGAVYKSTDGAASWNMTGLAGIAVFSLVVNPLTPTSLYAGTDGAVYRSTDGGASWNATSGLFGRVSSLAIDPLTPTTVYAGTAIYGGTPFGPSGGVYKSTDGGASWSPTLFGPPPGADTAFLCGPCGGVLALAIDPLVPTTLFSGTDALVEYDYWGEVVVWTSQGLVIKSTDGATSWTGSGFGAYTSADPILTLAVEPRTDPLTPATLWAGTSDAFKSTDGGASWSATGLTAGSGYVLSLAIDPVTPTTLFAGTYGGVFKSITGGANWNPTGLITWLHIFSLSLNPSNVIGGSPSTGTVTLTAPAPEGGAVVTLTSSDAAIATVPTSVTVAAGAMSADFTVSTSPIPVDASSAVRILGLYGGARLSAVLTVTPATSLTSLTLNPATVTAGGTSTGTVSLSAAAPPGGAEVPLSSSNPTVATVPASVTVPAGATSANFTVSTGSAITSTSVTIWAANYSAVLTVLPATTLASVSLNPASVTAGNASSGAVTLSAPAPAGGAMVALASSNTVATVPASVTVAAGATGTTFTVSTSTLTACPSSGATISATYGGATKSAGLTVTPTTDTVTIQQADYFASKRQLRVGAKSTSRSATLQVYVTSTGALIGTLQNLGDGRYTGQFTWPVNPQSITVRSSLCGSATKTVTAK